MGDETESPLFKGWSTKDLLFVGLSLAGLIAFASSLDKRIDIALKTQEHMARSITTFAAQHEEIMHQLSKINALVATLESKQEAQSSRLRDTEARSIECLKGTRR